MMSDVVMLSLDNGFRYDWQNIYKRLKYKQPENRSETHWCGWKLQTKLDRPLTTGAM